MYPKAPSLESTLHDVLQNATDILGARSGSLMLLDENTGELRIAVARGLPPEVVAQACARRGEGIAGWVIQHNRPRVLRRNERAADSLTEGERLPSAVSVPLRVRRRTIGVLNVSDPTGADFTQAHARILTAFAGQAAAAIENARLYAHLASRVDELGAIHQIGKALTSSLNLSRVLREVMRRAKQTLGATNGSIMLLNAERGELRIATAEGLDREIVRATRVPIGTGIAGSVALSGEPVVLRDGVVDARSALRPVHERVGAALCVPLRLQGRVIGVINIRRRVGTGSFSEEDLEFLTTLADQAAIAIENARLYRSLQQRVDLANQELVCANHLLAQEKSKIQAIVDGMADGVVVIDRAGRVTFINPTAEAMLAIPGEEALGCTLKHWPAGLSLQGVLDEAIQSDGMNVVKEMVLETPEYRVLSANVSPLRDGKEKPSGFIAVLTDITALREVSDLKTELVSFVSHELRNPITTIQGFAETLRHPGGELTHDLQQEFLGIITNECNRLLAMISEMLDISRMEAGRSLHLLMGPVAIRSLLERAIAAQRGYAHRHELVLDVAEDVGTITADGDKLYQVVTNLLSNAVKYSPHGGTIATSASWRGDRLRISVADQGLGIPPEMMGKLFQRYYRVETKAHTSIKGTGLGLFFVKGVVEAHGGTVWVESQYGKGSRFLFELPALPPDASKN